ncbi:precorrin-2 C(20)-methyltransferase [Candidatus Synechococcus calcipolaris G9]|uniref:Precorrin-2 C(20)-methyltransferase n=1 Tax=Candidatus Synechococcus calcipolaris G9 TaxID=1497997 RepID=A0ABT6EYA5_9SYNE|nr:precorrin-2 C(20)-methyltransferase [Candidatus Synechococcus calcipolaris]MDG2990792.1 precorrin-2 C(20)-methyltransferase [Candidatus Synechococcus calcipolaris G9]
MAGTLYGLSVGPGDPELITVKALGILQRVPVVAFPAGLGGKLGIAEGIAAPWLTPQQIRLPLDFPYVQDGAILRAAWQRAAQRVLEHLDQGEDVAFVCEGDVGFYSTFAYLAETLRQESNPIPIQIEIIPGVCSPLAAAAMVGQPLTLGGDRLVILPAMYCAEELEQVCGWADTVVLLKVRSVYPQVWQVLHRLHLLNRAVVVTWATTAKQRIYRNLEYDLHLELPYFSIMIIQISNPRDANLKTW